VAVLGWSMGMPLGCLEFVRYLGYFVVQQSQQQPSLRHPSIFGHCGILSPTAAPRATNTTRRPGKANLNDGLTVGVDCRKISRWLRSASAC